MFINKEILKKYNACGTGLRFIEKFYPNGVEILDLLDMRHIPPEILHWGAKFLPVSEEEMAKYYAYVGVENCENCIRSEEVKNSRHVARSKSIYDSAFIFSCQRVSNSCRISNSIDISDSSFIKDSNKVKNSQSVINGADIINCVNIINSSTIKDSDNISSCRNIVSSNALLHSSLCEYAGFSSFLKGCYKVLFCSSLTAENYMLFNKKVSQSIFENVWSQFLERIKFEDIKLIVGNEDGFFDGKANSRMESIFRVSEDFCDWVKSLPNYDNFIMYQITYEPKWLL